MIWLVIHANISIGLIWVTFTHEGADDVDDDEGSADVCVWADLSESHGWHGNKEPVDRLPVAQFVRFTVNRIRGVLDLQVNITIFSWIQLKVVCTFSLCS